MKPVKNIADGLVIGGKYKTKNMPDGYQKLARRSVLTIDGFHIDVVGRTIVSYRYIKGGIHSEEFARDLEDILAGVYL